MIQKKIRKNKIFRTKDNPKLIHNDIKTPHYLPISKINKKPSLITKSSNNSLKNTNYISSRVIEQLPATSEKEINILSWMGIMIISGLSYLGVRKNRYY